MGAEAEDVGVVVLDGPVGGVRIVAAGGTDDGEFVGGDASANAGAAEEEVAVGAALGDGGTDGADGVEEVARGRGCGRGGARRRGPAPRGRPAGRH